MQGDFREVFSENPEAYKSEYDMDVLKHEISSLPFAIEAGPGTLSGNEGMNYLVSDGAHHYMRLIYAKKYGENKFSSADSLLATYVVKGDTIEITYVETFKWLLIINPRSL